MGLHGGQRTGSIKAPSSPARIQLIALNRRVMRAYLLKKTGRLWGRPPTLSQQAITRATSVLFKEPSRYNQNHHHACRSAPPDTNAVCGAGKALRPGDWKQQL